MHPGPILGYGAPMDHERLAAELMRALRGTRSQVAFARRLGCRSNVPYSWESGRRFPPARTFFAAVGAAGIDADTALAGYLRGAPAPVREQPAAIAVLLDAIDGSTRADAAERCGIGVQALGRWVTGRSEPRLPDLLKVVDRAGQRLPDFVATFVDPDELPSLRSQWRQLKASRALVRASPWTGAILLALELDGYRSQPAHAPGWIAAALGIDPELEQAALGLLADAGQIRLRAGRYERVASAPIDARQKRPVGDLKRFWGQVALERLDAAALVSWNLVAVSRADLPALLDVQREAFRQMRQIVERSTPADTLALAHWSLVPLVGAQSTDSV